MTSDVPNNIQAVRDIILKHGEIDSDELYKIAKQEGVWGAQYAVKHLLRLGIIHQLSSPGKGATKKFVFGPLPES